MMRRQNPQIQRQNQFQLSNNDLNNNKLQNSQINSSKSYALNFKLPTPLVQYIKKQSKSQMLNIQNKKQILILKQRKSIIGKTVSNWNQRKNKITSMQNCPICQVQVNSQQMHCLNKICNHKFCLNCLVNYTTYKINLFQMVECPQQKCHQKLQKKTKVYQSLNQNLKQKYQQIIKYQSVQKDNNLHLCPNQNCNGIINLDSQDRKIICQTCKKQYCKICLMNFHTGNCDKHQILFYEAGLKFRQCKKCKRVVERISGCDHITCKCGYQFCYQCGQPWTRNHNCFNTPQCCIDKPFARIACKILYIIGFILLLYPLILLKVCTIVLSILLITLTIGIFVEPFVIFAQLYQKGLHFLILGLLLFPLVIIYGLIRATKQFFEEICGSVLTVEDIISPCILIKGVYDNCQQIASEQKEQF